MGFAKRVDDYRERENVSFDDALEMSGFGKYNFLLLAFCCFLLQGMIMETLGFSFIIPSSQCDLELTDNMKGWVATIPFTGFILTSHLWGYIADTYGRRTVILICTVGGSTFSILSSFSPDIYTFVVLRFTAALFIAGCSALCYAFLGEFTPARHRDRMVSLANASVILAEAVVPCIAWIVLPRDFNFPFYVETGYRPWRLLICCFALPSIICAIACKWVPESPKFILAQGRTDEALAVLRRIYTVNTGNKEEDFCVKSLEPENFMKGQQSGFLGFWKQSMAIMKPPYLLHSLLFWFLHFVSFAMANGFYIWLPEVVNRIWASDRDGTLCEIVSYKTSNITLQGETSDCNDTLQIETYLVTIVVALAMTLVTLYTAYIVNVVGKVYLSVGTFWTAAICTFAIHWVDNRYVSILLFCSTLLCNTNIGLVNAAVVEVFPTNMRAMAVCVSMMVGRIGSMVFSKLIGTLLEMNCPLCFFGTSALLTVAGILSWCLPNSKKK